MINEPGKEIPDKTVLIIPNRGISNQEVASLMTPLTTEKKRDWFTPHFYYCLPLAIGNRYGFIVRAQRDFTAYWNGKEDPSGVTITDTPTERRLQFYDGHFGSGIITVQNVWHFRTPPGVNLMTISPPNFPQHGLMHMTGVIETDNLRRDFTFNLKITKPNITISIKAGDPIGAFIPIPRYYADAFSLKYADELYTEQEINLEHASGDEFARQRSTEDKEKAHAAGRKYFQGEDAYGNKFPDHQR